MPVLVDGTEQIVSSMRAQISPTLVLASNPTVHIFPALSLKFDGLHEYFEQRACVFEGEANANGDCCVAHENYYFVGRKIQSNV